MADLVLSGEGLRFDEVFYPQWQGRAGMELAPDALSESLAADPHVSLLVNHEGLPLASTRAKGDTGRLSLAVTDSGLSWRANLDPSDDLSAAVHSRVRNGLMAQASAGFYLTEAEWVERDGEDVLRVTAAEIHRGDVSVVTYGANPNASTRTAASPKLPFEDEPKAKLEVEVLRWMTWID